MHDMPLSRSRGQGSTPTPSSLAEDEAVVTGSLVVDFPVYPDQLPTHLLQLVNNAPESCDDLRNGEILASIRQCIAAGEKVNFVTVRHRLKVTSHEYLSLLVKNTLPISVVESAAKQLCAAYQVRRTKTILREALASLEQSPSMLSTITKSVCISLEDAVNDAGGLPDRLAARIYSPTAIPIEPMPRFFLGGIQICTPGNLTVVSSQAKAGKSTNINAMIASTFAVPGADCLGYTSENPHGHAVLHIDTEQCRYDHWEGVQRVIRRAKVKVAPPWFRSYCLTGFRPAEIRVAIPTLTKLAAKQFGGIHSVFVDGIADATEDVNDPAESNSIVNEIHALAIEFECPIINIIHTNPASDFKTRGHLGSQLERKSETNLRLEKDNNGVTIIFADKNRRAPIHKDAGPRFAWCQEAAMHISVATACGMKASAKLDELREQCHEAFRLAEKPALSWTDLVQTLTRVPGVHSKRTAERIHMGAKREGIISKNLIGHWELSANRQTTAKLPPM